jgi:hypothetical protein
VVEAKGEILRLRALLHRTQEERGLREKEDPS